MAKRKTILTWALLPVAVLAVISAVYGFRRKRPVSPILLIGVSAVMGCVLF